LAALIKLRRRAWPRSLSECCLQAVLNKSSANAYHRRAAGLKYRRDLIIGAIFGR
jgi:hypothetical protein